MSELHRVWRVGADVDTDQLAPGAYMKLGILDIAKHCLEGVRPEFAGQVKSGDVLAAGPNFGIGSSREQAADALVKLGVKAVIAPSYGGLYFRNAFNLGLLLLTCKEAESLEEGEQISLDLNQWAVVCVCRNKERQHEKSKITPNCSRSKHAGRYATNARLHCGRRVLWFNSGHCTAQGGH